MNPHCLLQALALAAFAIAAIGSPVSATTPPAPRWWCPLATPATAVRDPRLLAAALAQRDTPPQPMARVHTQGLLPGQGIHDASAAAERDWPRALRAAVAWRMGGDPALLHQVAHYLDAWSGTYQPDFNPIDETNLGELFQAWALTRAALPAATNAAMAGLARRMAGGYLARLQAKTGSTYINDINNWQSHRIKLLAITATTLGDPVLVTAARQWLMTQVAANIQPDGRTVDFVQRDALHYVTYDLEPLVQAALALTPYGNGNLLDARSATGSSLAAALAWLAPYADGQRTHQEFVHTSEPFDIEREKAGLKGYSGRWNPHNAATLYAYAAVLAPGYAPLATRLGSPPAVLSACATRSAPTP